MTRNVARICVTAILISACWSLHADDSESQSLAAVRPWGRIVPQQAALELHVLEIPENRVIDFPRLNNRMRRLYVEGTSVEESGLGFRPQIETWEVVLPASFSSNKRAVVVFETLEDIQFSPTPFVVEQQPDGSFTLPAHHVVTHGTLLRYEPQPHKNTVGYWANVNDWAEWHLHVRKPMEFTVEVLQGCGKDQGGSKVEIELAGRRVDFIVEDTGHFQNFVSRQVGTIKVGDPGRYQLKMRAIEKARSAVGDIRRIRLIPVVPY